MATHLRPARRPDPWRSLSRITRLYLVILLAILVALGAAGQDGFASLAVQVAALLIMVTAVGGHR